MRMAVDLCESGLDALCWERLCIIACEDVGLANPEAVILTNSLADTWMRLREQKEGSGKPPEKNLLRPSYLDPVTG